MEHGFRNIRMEVSLRHSLDRVGITAPVSRRCAMLGGTNSLPKRPHYPVQASSIHTDYSLLVVDKPMSSEAPLRGTSREIRNLISRRRKFW